jgi:hypothetical protein
MAQTAVAVKAKAIGAFTEAVYGRRLDFERA